MSTFNVPCDMILCYFNCLTPFTEYFNAQIDNSSRSKCFLNSNKIQELKKIY